MSLWRDENCDCANRIMCFFHDMATGLRNYFGF